jgi:hypothetical protein
MPGGEADHLAGNFSAVGEDTPGELGAPGLAVKLLDGGRVVFEDDGRIITRSPGRSEQDRGQSDQFPGIALKGAIDTFSQCCQVQRFL